MAQTAGKALWQLVLLSNSKDSSVNRNARKIRVHGLLLAVVHSLILLLPTIAFADFSGRVVGVSDGDTIKVMHNGHAERIRLFGIDAPEKGQAFGTKAKQFASEATFGKMVTVVEHGTDKYGRTLGDVMLSDGSSLNQELVRAGLAWWYQKYVPHDTTLRELEDQARLERRGLWADKDPIPPWKWRKGRRE